MKGRHFESLRPICPVCRTQFQRDEPLELGFVVRENADSILEGALRCPAPGCGHEFPIVDGIPVLVPDPAGYLATNLFQVMARKDLSSELEAMLGKVADTYEEQVETTVSRLTALLEPLLILIMVGIVVVIILATLVPLLQVTSSL